MLAVLVHTLLPFEALGYLRLDTLSWWELLHTQTARASRHKHQFAELCMAQDAASRLQDRHGLRGLEVMPQNRRLPPSLPGPGQ